MRFVSILGYTVKMNFIQYFRIYCNRSFVQICAKFRKDKQRQNAHHSTRNHCDEGTLARQTVCLCLLRKKVDENEVKHDNSEGLISIPQECMKLVPNISSAAELRNLLPTIRFWGLEFNHDVILDFILSKPAKCDNTVAIINPLY